MADHLDRAPGGQVEHVRDVLPLQDLHPRQVAAGRHDLPIDHRARFGEEAALPLAAGTSVTSSALVLLVAASG